MGLTLSGSNVTAWADQSGNGNDFTAYSDTYFPQLVTGQTPNGMPIVRFVTSDGNNPTPMVTSNAFLNFGGSPTNPFWWYFVFKFNGNTTQAANYSVLMVTGDVANDQGIYTWLYTGGSPNQFNLGNDEFGATANATFDTTNFHVYQAQFDGSGVPGPSNTTLLIDNTALTNSGSAIGGIGTLTSTMLSGNPFAGGQNACAMDLAAVYLYNQTPTMEQQAQLYAYIQRRFGL